MNITWPPTGLTPLTVKTKESPVSEGISSFGEIFSNALQNVESLEQQSQEAKISLATGEIDDVHQVMIASEKANMALQLTVHVRNKIFEAYQEIMRMQM